MLRLAAGQALGKGVEHTNRGVINHAVDGNGHGDTEPWVNLLNHGQRGHLCLSDRSYGDVEATDQDRQQEEEACASENAAVAHLLGIEEVATDYDHHGDHHDDVQPQVIDSRDPPVGQRRRKLLCLLVEMRPIGVGGEYGVDGADGQQDDDERGDGTNGDGHLVHIEQAG